MGLVCSTHGRDGEKHKKLYSGKLKTEDRLGDLCVSGKGNIYFSIYVCMYVCMYLFIYSLFTRSVAQTGEHRLVGCFMSNESEEDL